MSMRREDVLKLLQLLKVTTDDEINCSEFLQRIAGYLERLREGELVPPGYEQVVQHLQICPECKEECAALYRALQEKAP